MMQLQSSLGRVRGLGASNHGAGHWWAQRITAIALVPLAIWFVIAAIGLIGADHATFSAWLGSFGNALLMILLAIALFYHAYLGMQVVLEDYVSRHGTLVAALIAVKLLLFALAASCVLAVVLVAIRS
jgi:succinate dehydrogenase / fumarate reductase membrane anchor subunit